MIPRIYAMAGGVLAALLLLSACGQYTPRGTVLEPPNEAPDFTLTDHTGQPFRLSEQRGTLLLLFFGFTSCPDICPTELSNLAKVQRELGADAERVRVVLISLDPERDTPDRLRQYVTAFHPSFVGLRGAQEELAPIIKDYGVIAQRRDLPGSALGYTIDHSGYVYLIDPAGNWRELFAMGTTAEDIASDVRYVLRSSGGQVKKVGGFAREGLALL